MMPAFEMTGVVQAPHAVEVAKHHEHPLAQTSLANLAEGRWHRYLAFGSRSQEHGCHHRDCEIDLRMLQRRARTRRRFFHHTRKDPKANPARVGEPSSVWNEEERDAADDEYM
jgi:hypothetical protein